MTKPRTITVFETRLRPGERYPTAALRRFKERPDNQKAVSAPEVFEEVAAA